ncbi:hypothetical protein [Streptomyces yunnanensis]|uniref:Uncharacterized protein n=1 Tax=Streptomyces yunnanensis TaxID=156453 RepID=A0A9X8QYE9_9ACTN|nr:hypothetical protein [Streptomyces yunnanensis]SHN07354.1 hypothetical protein SAMN05216268_11914 [Streptomyces yunnanensis]
MTESTDSVGLPRSKKSRRRRALWWAAGSSVLAAAAGVTVWVWQPWVDRSPFTAYEVSVAPGEHASPGSKPGSCVPHASEEEIALFDGGGQKIAQARQSREGELLSSEFGEFAGECLVVTRIDNVPGGEDTYVYQWGGGTKRRMTEEELRRPVAEQRESFKTLKKTEAAPPDLDS